MRIALVFNPDSARARLDRIAALERVLVARGHVPTRHDSLSFRHATDAPDAELICICGGDGTARLVIDAQDNLAALPPLALFPLGTINLLARELGYPANPRAFAGRIEQDVPPRVHAIATVGERRFLACASLGADAWAVAEVSVAHKARIGRFAYLVSLIRLLRDWPRHPLRVLAGGETIAAEALFVLRGRYYAGPWTLDREAGLSRDRLHVLVLPRARRRDLMALIWYGLTGARRPGRNWRFLRVSEFSAEADCDVPLQVDGDVLDPPATMKFRLSDQSIRWK